MTRPWRECRHQRLSKGKEKSAAAADQRKLNAKVSITDITAEVENDWWECHKTCWGPWWFGLKSPRTLHKDLQLQRSRLGGWPKCHTRRWEGAIKNMRDDHGNDRRDFLTILDNILTVGVWSGGEEWSCRPRCHPGGRIEGAGGGNKKWFSGRLPWGTPAVIRALWEVCEDCRWPYWKKLKIQNGLPLFYLFLEVFRVSSYHTLYILDIIAPPRNKFIPDNEKLGIDEIVKITVLPSLTHLGENGSVYPSSRLWWQQTFENPMLRGNQSQILWCMMLIDSLCRCWLRDSSLRDQNTWNTFQYQNNKQ